MLDPRTAIGSLHPAMRPRAQALYNDLLERGIDPVFIEGKRDIERQRKLYAQGRTAPGDIVTHAKPGRSYHNYGLAFDIAPRAVLDQPNWAPDHEHWAAVGDAAKQHDLTWGGNFDNIVDKPHMQYNGLSMDQLVGAPIDASGYVQLANLDNTQPGVMTDMPNPYQMPGQVPMPPTYGQLAPQQQQDRRIANPALFNAGLSLLASAPSGGIDRQQGIKMALGHLSQMGQQQQQQAAKPMTSMGKLNYELQQGLITPEQYQYAASNLPGRGANVNVQVGMPGQQEQSNIVGANTETLGKEKAKSYVKRYSDAVEQAQTARSTMADLSTLKSLVGNYNTGHLGSAKLQLKKLGSTFGFDSDVHIGEQINQITKKLAIQALQFFAGTTTDFEFRQTENIQAGIDLSEKANMAILERDILKMEMIQEQPKLMEAYERKYGFHNTDPNAPSLEQFMDQGYNKYLGKLRSLNETINNEVLGQDIDAPMPPAAGAELYKGNEVTPELRRRHRDEVDFLESQGLSQQEVMEMLRDTYYGDQY